MRRTSIDRFDSDVTGCWMINEMTGRVGSGRGISPMASFAQFDWDATLLHATWEIPTHLWATSQLNSIQFGSQRPKSPKLTALRGNQNQTVMAWIYLLIVQHCGYHTVLTHSPAQPRSRLRLWRCPWTVDGCYRFGMVDSTRRVTQWRGHTDPTRRRRAVGALTCVHSSMATTGCSTGMDGSYSAAAPKEAEGAALGLGDRCRVSTGRQRAVHVFVLLPRDHSLRVRVQLRVGHRCLGRVHGAELRSQVRSLACSLPRLFPLPLVIFNPPPSFSLSVSESLAGSDQVVVSWALNEGCAGIRYDSVTTLPVDCICD